MKQKGSVSYFDFEGYKTFCMNEAWDYFKKKEKIPMTCDRLYFELHEKNEKLKERWGAFKHTYTSAAFTSQYGEKAAKMFGDANEIIQLGSVKSFKSKKDYNPGNEPQDRRMDLKDNAAGRKISSKNSGLKLIDEVYYALDNNNEIVLNQHINNNSSYKDTNIVLDKIWETADKAFYESKSKKLKKNSISNQLNTGSYQLTPNEDYEDIFLKNQIQPEKTLSLKEQLLQEREAKLAYYTSRLAEDPEKIKEREAKHVSLEDLTAPQEARKQKVRDIVEGKVQFDEKMDISSYENKKRGDNKIFTNEEIESMTDEEKHKNKEAIFYQKQNIGIPSEEQAKKSVSNGGMIFVKGYTRADGTEVKSYYRSR